MTDKLNTTRPTPKLLEQLSAIVGRENAIFKDDEEGQYHFLREPRNKYIGQTPLVLKPGSTDEVSKILALCNTHGVGVIPQGGNTGLVGGQVPFSEGADILVSTIRLDDIRNVDNAGRTITVGAGCILANIQQLADEMDCLFPLRLASEGSCQIGGNLATNAGGVGVLAYGNMRNLVLGLEVVLADGRIWHGLRANKKDNTGYDLRDLFIGSEGTLGFITAATLKLFPKPADKATALITVNSLEQLADVFQTVSQTSKDLLTGFEFFPHLGLEFVLSLLQVNTAPFSDPYPWYALIETSRSANDGGASENLSEVLSGLAESEKIDDAIVAISSAQAEQLWRLREAMSEAQKAAGGSIKHDISVPIAAIPEFVTKANALVEKMCPGARPVPFGHFGDGNIHYNISQPVGADKQSFLGRWDEISSAIHDLVVEFDGSISAEHGIGRMKRTELARLKAPVELELMRTIKSALDANAILNPGKLL